MTDEEARLVGALLDQLAWSAMQADFYCTQLNQLCTTHAFTVRQDPTARAGWKVVMQPRH